MQQQIVHHFQERLESCVAPLILNNRQLLLPWAFILIGHMEHNLYQFAVVLEMFHRRHYHDDECGYFSSFRARSSSITRRLRKPTCQIEQPTIDRIESFDVQWRPDERYNIDLLWASLLALTLREYMFVYTEMTLTREVNQQCSTQSKSPAKRLEYHLFEVISNLDLLDRILSVSPKYFVIDRATD